MNLLSPDKDGLVQQIKIRLDEEKPSDFLGIYASADIAHFLIVRTETYPFGIISYTRLCKRDDEPIGLIASDYIISKVKELISEDDWYGGGKLTNRNIKYLIHLFHKWFGWHKHSYVQIYIHTVYKPSTLKRHAVRVTSDMIKKNEQVNGEH